MFLVPGRGHARVPGAVRPSPPQGPSRWVRGGAGAPQNTQARQGLRREPLEAWFSGTWFCPGEAGPGSGVEALLPNPRRCRKALGPALPPESRAGPALPGQPPPGDSEEQVWPLLICHRVGFQDPRPKEEEKQPRGKNQCKNGHSGEGRSGSARHSAHCPRGQGRPQAPLSSEVT